MREDGVMEMRPCSVSTGTFLAGPKQEQETQRKQEGLGVGTLAGRQESRDNNVGNF